MDTSSTVPEGAARLRGHHLMCLNFFDGEGYSQPFVDNLRGAVAAADQDGIVLIEGADAVCAACDHLAGGVCKDEEEIDRLDRLARSLLGVAPGAALTWDEIGARLPDILDAWYVGACEECEFVSVCTGAGLADLCDSAADSVREERP
jgi:uncharacterized protein